MNKTAWIVATTTVITAGLLQGQNAVYQQAGAISVTTGMIGGGGLGMVMAGGMRTIAGSPFSATEQRHSLQVLGDGTRIERTETSQISRDGEGRTRTEVVPSDNNERAMVTIQDPVAGANYFLDPQQKTANKMPAPPVPKGIDMRRIAPLAGGAVSFSDSGSGIPRMTQVVTMEAVKTANAPAEDNLGTQTVNGVLAKGTRTTIDISAGQIGNDRAIQVVSERWYSDDLQMAVKSSNSDPRFGTTTYELTNISRTEPDPTLFQVPPDYTVKEGKAFFTAAPAK